MMLLVVDQWKAELVDAYAEIIATRPLGIGGILLYTNGCRVARIGGLSRFELRGRGLDWTWGRVLPTRTFMQKESTGNT